MFLERRVVRFLPRREHPVHVRLGLQVEHGRRKLDASQFAALNLVPVPPDPADVGFQVVEDLGITANPRVRIEPQYRPLVLPEHLLDEHGLVMAVPGPVSAALVFFHGDAQAHRAGRSHHVPYLFGVGRVRSHGTDYERAVRFRREFSHGLVKRPLLETRESRRAILRHLDAHGLQFRRPLRHVRQHLVGDARFLFARIAVVVMLLRIAGVVHVVAQQANVLRAECGGQVQGERPGVVERRKAALKVKIGSAGARTVDYEDVLRYAVVLLGELAVYLQPRVVAPRITELAQFSPRQESRRVWPIHECSHANVGPFVAPIAADGNFTFQKTPIEVLEAWATAD